MDQAPPTAGRGPLYKEPLVVLATLIVLLQAVLGALGGGMLDDGFQFDPDGLALIGLIFTTLLGRAATWSQATVDRLAPRSAQVREVEAGGPGHP